MSGVHTRKQASLQECITDQEYRPHYNIGVGTRNTGFTTGVQYRPGKQASLQEWSTEHEDRPYYRSGIQTKKTGLTTGVEYRLGTQASL